MILAERPPLSAHKNFAEFQFQPRKVFKEGSWMEGVERFERFNSSAQHRTRARAILARSKEEMVDLPFLSQPCFNLTTIAFPSKFTRKKHTLDHKATVSTTAQVATGTT